jgi:predicted HTH transcriptional regulator
VIYFDRIEITNPGGLVSGLQKKDFGKVNLDENNNLTYNVGNNVGNILN